MSKIETDIHEAMFVEAEERISSLQVARIQPIKISWIEHQVKQLEDCGGNLQRFTGNLFQVEQQLSLFENKELAKRWATAIAISNKIRKQLITCKALKTFEDYSNLSNTSSASDISFARAALFMCNTDKEKDINRKEDERELDEYEEVERDLKGENDA